MTELNTERGEVGIPLDGKIYPMRPSYEAMQSIEEELGPLLALVTRHAHPMKRLTVREMSIIVTQAIRAAGKHRGDVMLRSVTRERVAELLYEGGLVKAADPLEKLMVNMISGGSKATKKKDQATEDPGASNTAE